MKIYSPLSTINIAKLTRRFQKLFIGSFITLLILCISGIAQEGMTADRGVKPGGSYGISDIESVSMSSGNLMLHVPLASLPAGRGGMSAKLNLIYNSKLYDTHIDYASLPCDPNRDPLCNSFSKHFWLQQNNLTNARGGGWTYGVSYAVEHYG